MSGPQGSSTPAFVDKSQSNGVGGTQSANGKGKAPAPRKVPASFGKTKGSIWCVAVERGRLHFVLYFEGRHCLSLPVVVAIISYHMFCFSVL